MKYRGRILVNWFGQHPAFSDGPNIEQELFTLEMNAAEIFGFNIYFEASRLERQNMVGHLYCKSAVKMMAEYDAHKKAEAKVKGKGRGKK